MSASYLIVTDVAGVIVPWLFDSREEFDKAVQFCAENRREVRVRYITENNGAPDYVTDADELANYFKEVADL